MLPREKGGGSKHHNHLSAPTINSNGPSPFFLASAPAPRFTQVLLSAASVVVTLTLTDCETGESIAAQCPGYAEDPKSDKSLWKAVTGASKYVIRSFFCLATTDDPEQEDDQVRPHSKPSATNSQPTRPATVNTLQPPASTTVNPTVNVLQPVPSESTPNQTATNNGSSPTTLEQTSVEMERIGWTSTEGRQFLEQTLGWNEHGNRKWC